MGIGIIEKKIGDKTSYKKLNLRRRRRRRQNAGSPQYLSIYIIYGELKMKQSFVDEYVIHTL